MANGRPRRYRRRSTAHMPDELRTATLGERTGRMEGEIENLREDVEAGRAETKNLSDRIDQMGRDISRRFESLTAMLATVGKTNWQVVFQGGLLVAILFGAGLTPLWITSNNLNDKAQEARDWQKDYQLGKIPSSSAPDLAALKEHNAEVEAQFRGVGKELQTQIDHNTKENDRLNTEITRVRDHEWDMIQRLSKAEQELVDHDRFLWPTVEDNQRTIMNLPKKN